MVIFMGKSEKPLIIVAGMLGAGCTHVATIISEKLGIDYVNTERILREIVVDRRISYAELSKMASSGEIELEKIMRNILLDYVNERNIIIEGRSALLVLDKPADLKVFLWAPFEYRAKVVAERRGITLDEAKEAVRYSDEERENLVRRLYERDWLDADLYDLVINSSRWSYKEIADMIMNAYKLRGNRNKQ